jgi:hypothetical protein
MKKKNQIKSIEFVRMTDDISPEPQHKLILNLTGKIPAMGYSCKEIRKMLKDFDTPLSNPPRKANN